MTNTYENVFPDNKKCFYYVLPDIIYGRYYPSNGNCEGEGKGESLVMVKVNQLLVLLKYI